MIFSSWLSRVLKKSTHKMQPHTRYRFCNSFALSEKPAVLVGSFPQFVNKVYMSTFAEPPSPRPFRPSFPRPRDASLVSTR